ncbi:hypothetical protein N7495_006735 [Penicillium taxi]|uniref:uncharacterized protein n=1 Tax=Penicillium taxi TaxID=168475 RepID=UPI0025456824|nr:uncharacterized protein N7495_006735 [Penicillium taxi]KAJ5895044.1 hypothetical protein N7495_006735 [Penicillium taxi]
MPVQVHDAHIGWVHSEMMEWQFANLLSRAEVELCRSNVGTTIDFIKGSKMQPDLYFWVNRTTLPTFSIETGWSESFPRLLRDKELLLDGSQGACQTVMIISWRKHVRNRVAGNMQVWKWDQGQKTLSQTLQIFPRPTNGHLQTVNLTRMEIFGQSILPGRNPADTFTLHLDNLRNIAGDAIHLMGYTPA